MTAGEIPATLSPDERKKLNQKLVAMRICHQTSDRQKMTSYPELQPSRKAKLWQVEGWTELWRLQHRHGFLVTALFEGEGVGALLTPPMLRRSTTTNPTSPDLPNRLECLHNGTCLLERYKLEPVHVPRYTCHSFARYTHDIVLVSYACLGSPGGCPPASQNYFRRIKSQALDGGLSGRLLCRLLA